MLTVACVLKSGGEYGPQHVTWLRCQVERHLRVPYRFVCLSDVELLFFTGLPHKSAEVDCEWIRLENDWPGWWSKINLMKLPVEGPIIYFDLDTLIVGSLDELVTGHRFAMLESFWPNLVVNSSVMAWSIDLSQIYDRFAEDPQWHMNDYRVAGRWGDQDFIANNSPVGIELLQDRHPGKFVSYKLTLKGGPVPPEAAVVVFHGKPKPWQTELGRQTYETYR